MEAGVQRRLLLLRDRQVELGPAAGGGVLRGLVGEGVEFARLQRIGRNRRLVDRGGEVGQAGQHGAMHFGRHAQARRGGALRRPVAVALVQVRETRLEQGHQRGIAFAALLGAVELAQVVVDGGRLLLGAAVLAGLAGVDVDLGRAGHGLDRQRALTRIGLEIEADAVGALGADRGFQRHRRQHAGVELGQRAQRQLGRHRGQAIDGVLERFGQAGDGAAFFFGELGIAHVDLHAQALFIAFQGNRDLGAAGGGDAQRDRVVGHGRALGRGDAVHRGGGAGRGNRQRVVAAIILHAAQQGRGQALELAGQRGGADVVGHERGERVGFLHLPGGDRLGRIGQHVGRLAQRHRGGRGDVGAAVDGGDAGHPGRWRLRGDDERRGVAGDRGHVSGSPGGQQLPNEACRGVST
ncbi:Uncharacterised protein [Achromobacter xylosoxidans]|nr:Uncharacterised protein [Achromobacter xylosoxidans]